MWNSSVESSRGGRDGAEITIKGNLDKCRECMLESAFLLRLFCVVSFYESPTLWQVILERNQQFHQLR